MIPWLFAEQLYGNGNDPSHGWLDKARCHTPKNCLVETKVNAIKEECQKMHLSDTLLREVMLRLRESIELGLQKLTHATSVVKCSVTYVQDLPNGKERGRFMSLEFGSARFRIALIELSGYDHTDVASQTYSVTAGMLNGPGKRLFNHIAECLADFLNEHKLSDERLSLALAFGFPYEQKGLAKGVLITWSKGFNCKGVVGKDIVKLLNDAIKRKNINVNVVAILSDATGVLMSCAWKQRDCKIAFVIGTGTNASYVESVDKADMYTGGRSKPYVIINTEWGAFGDDGALDFIRTHFDCDIDERSINPGAHLFEKMIAGLYIGEIVRLILVRMTNEKILFRGQGSEILNARGRFSANYMAAIECDEVGKYIYCREILRKLGLAHATDEDCDNVRYICQAVGTRAAHLSAAGIATLVNKISAHRITIGIDGSLYRYHPHFHHRMFQKMLSLVQPGLKFDFMLSEDGAGSGAALVAATAIREEIDKNVKAKFVS